MTKSSPSRRRMIFIVGPSGAGKDTLLDHARQAFAGDDRVHFVRRAITRPASVGEDHEAMDEAAFEHAAGRQKFALHWKAHGLSYGLPVAIDTLLMNGDVVIANGSRAVIPSARVRYPDLQVVLITAAPEILAERLAGRGRETEAGQTLRMVRSQSIDVELDGAITIDNSGPVEVAGGALVAFIRSVCADPSSEGQS